MYTCNISRYKLFSFCLIACGGTNKLIYHVVSCMTEVADSVSFKAEEKIDNVARVPLIKC